MGFNKLNKTVRAVETELTTSQKDKICDLFAEGKSVSQIKHLMIHDFDPGKRFHHLVRGAVSKMKQVETTAFTLMSGQLKDKLTEEGEQLYFAAPKTLKSFQSELYKTYSDCDKSCLDKLLVKVVEATGTWEEYKDCFSKE